jgi:hypothetical protein
MYREFFIKNWDVYMKRDNSFKWFTMPPSPTIRIETFIPDSSWIERVTYDKITKILTTYFNGGGYFYHDVPAGVFEDFKNAASPGEFFNTNIKNNYMWSAVDSLT